MNTEQTDVQNKIALESLAMDLKRVALGYHRNSLPMAKRFYEEAMKRQSEVNVLTIKPYLYGILKQIVGLRDQPSDRVADDALMFSTLIQNYTRAFLP